jgi:hypothetical protein
MCYSSGGTSFFRFQKHIDFLKSVFTRDGNPAAFALACKCGVFLFGKCWTWVFDPEAAGKKRVKGLTGYRCFGILHELFGATLVAG